MESVLVEQRTTTMTDSLRASQPHASGADVVTLFLCGDVMTGRGVDQIMPWSCPPHLFERVCHSAMDYVALAERAHGPIERPASHTYVWGVALEVLEDKRPAARIVNLETSVTMSEDAMPKGINYRMHPANVAVLSAARIDCVVLANNHVLDWGEAGLLETLDTLAAAGIPVAGAGRSIRDAEAPAVLTVPRYSRVLVFGLGGPDSGIPPQWGATSTRPGVHRLSDYSQATVEHVTRIVKRVKRSSDIALASVHWGGNWGYDIPTEHRQFAHWLIERAGVDVVHGHSSHHPKAIEIYRGRLILYGCGDFLNDYEGIRGRDEYRDDLTLMYFPTIDTRTGELAELELVPLLIRHFRLEHPPAHKTTWLRDTLDRECQRFGHRVIQREGSFVLEWR